MKTVEDLNEKQIEFIKNNAIELFEITFLPPYDHVDDIVKSTCTCCRGQRDFLRELLKLK
jgi:hypothetical protein